MLIKLDDIKCRTSLRLQACCAVFDSERDVFDNARTVFTVHTGSWHCQCMQSFTDSAYNSVSMREEKNGFAEICGKI